MGTEVVQGVIQFTCHYDLDITRYETHNADEVAEKLSSEDENYKRTLCRAKVCFSFSFIHHNNIYK